jgi:hypothetical protein
MFRSGLAGLLWAGLAASGMAAAPAAWAQDQSERDPSDLALDGLNRLLQALNVFIDSIPQYEAPYINEEGDIIIRRKRDDAPLPPRIPDDDRHVTPLPGDTDSTRI